MKEMILASNQAKILLSQSDNSQIRTFLKNIGSNFILKGKKFQFEGKIGWRALLNSPQNTNWRRERDSNPRSAVRQTTVFETVPFDRSGIPPDQPCEDTCNL